MRRARAGARWARARVTCRLTHVYPDGAAPYFTVLAPARRGSEVEQWDEIKAAASEAIEAAGGTITHHHAVGRDHRPWYDRQRPEPFAEALRAAKRAVDPDAILNPGVLDRPVTAGKRDLARADRIMPGLWRLRLPLPWPGVPHVNAFAISAGSGVVLVDTGMHEPGALGQLERALDQAGLRLEHIRLVVCTHAHSDHYGLAAPIVEAAGCELWMHPNHEPHDPRGQGPRADARAPDRGRAPRAACRPRRSSATARRAAARGSAWPRWCCRTASCCRASRSRPTSARWQVHETPGHAPSHVCLHQPERRLILSGDHVIGRVSLYYDFGYTPDPAGEFLSSLDVVDELEVDLCLAGHGRPRRDFHALVAANRDAVHERIERVRAASPTGRRPRSSSCRSCSARASS